MTLPIKNYGPEFLADLQAEADAVPAPGGAQAGWPSGIDIADEIDSMLPTSMGYSTRAAVEQWWRDLVARKLSKLAAPAPAEGDKVEFLSEEWYEACIPDPTVIGAGGGYRHFKRADVQWAMRAAVAAYASQHKPKGTAAELADVLRALLEQTFRGHTLADRLQFSTTGRELLRRADAAMAAAPSPAPAPEVLDGYKLVPLEPTPEMHEAYWTAARVPLSDAKFPAEVYRAMVAAAPAIKAPAVRDEPQDIGGHIRAAANARVAQQADDDTRRLDYLQKKQATISLVPDGRDEKGTRHAFMVGGWHCSVNRDVRASIDAAMSDSHVPVQGSRS